MTVLRHDLAIQMESARASYGVIPAKRDKPFEPEPVVLSATRGVFGLQDYFTPEQAEELAAALVEGARLARELNPAVVAEEAVA